VGTSRERILFAGGLAIEEELAKDAGEGASEVSGTDRFSSNAGFKGTSSSTAGVGVSEGAGVDLLPNQSIFRSSLAVAQRPWRNRWISTQKRKIWS
jgi:hypothetical protein